jgi:hypothetical protein
MGLVDACLPDLSRQPRPRGLFRPLHNQHRRLQSLPPARHHPRTLFPSPLPPPYSIDAFEADSALGWNQMQFHQVVRAATPLFTIMISVLVLRASFSRMKILSLLPVVAGVGFAYVSSASPLAAAEKILISATQKLIDFVFLKIPFFCHASQSCRYRLFSYRYRPAIGLTVSHSQTFLLTFLACPISLHLYPLPLLSHSP